MTGDPTERARRVVAAHLAAGERIEVALPAGFYDAPTRRNLVRQLELFLGVQLGHPRALVLTTRRLLVLPLAAKDKPGEGWYVAQLATATGLRATGWQERGGLCVVCLEGRLGERRLVLRARDTDRGRTLARLLGLTAPTPG